MTYRKADRRSAGFSTDTTLGVIGGCLATGSAAFALFMTMHGPLASFGTNRDFTIFAQFASRTRSTTLGGPARPDDLDTTATASIPKRAAALASEPAGVAAVTLQAADGDSAQILVDGRSRLVHVGDTIPGAGEVISIVAGAHPVVRTSRGLIASAANDATAP